MFVCFFFQIQWRWLVAATGELGKTWCSFWLWGLPVVFGLSRCVVVYLFALFQSWYERVEEDGKTTIKVANSLVVFLFCVGTLPYFFTIIIWNNRDWNERSTAIRQNSERLASVVPPGTQNLAGCWRTAITACCFASSSGHTTWRPWLRNHRSVLNRSMVTFPLLVLYFSLSSYL